jgi:diguanylate cyclase (GGDEF)-like protein/PAS domain S-box-containing protein
VQGPDTDLTAALEGVTDAFFILDGEWRFTYFNSEAERVLARDGDSLLGGNLREELPNTLGSPLYRSLFQAVESQSTVEFRQYHPLLDAWFEVRAYPLHDGLAVSFRELNGQVDKDRLEFLERVLEASSAGAFITDAASPENPIVFANRALQRMTGYTAEEMLGNNCRFLLGTNRDQPQLDELRKAIRTGENWSGILRNYRRDGTMFYNELYISPIRDQDGCVTHYVGVQNDVTARVRSRERHEETIRQRSAAMQSSMDGISISGADGRLTHLNQAHADLYGYANPDEMTGMNWRQLYGEEQVSEFERRVIPALAEEGRWRGEFVGSRKDGSEFPQELSLSLLEDGGTICVVRDITQRKRAEEAAAASESRLEEAQSVAGIGSWEWSFADESLTWSREEYSIFGVDPESFEADLESLLQLIHPDDRERVVERMRQPPRETGLIESEYRIVRPGGEVREIYSRQRTERDESGEPIRVLGTIQDVTERRRDEAASRILASIVENSEEAIVGNTFEGIVTSWNPAAERLFGYTAYEMVGESIGLLNPEERPGENLETIRTVCDTGVSDRRETVRAANDGTRIEVSVTSSPVRDAVGNVIGTSAIFKDISDRKAAESALSESEARFRNLVELSPDAIAVHSEGVMLYINPAGAQLLGAEHPEEILGKPLMSLIHPAYRDSVRERVDRIQAEGVEAEPLEEKFLRLDGGSVDVEVAGLPITYGGRPAVQFLARDITERKRAEEAFRQSEERYRGIVEDQTEMICRFSPDRTLTFINDAYSQHLGIGREDLLGSNFMSLMPEEEYRALEEHLSDLGPDKPVNTIEHRVVTGAGEVRWHQWTDRALFDERGDLTGYQSVGRDVTARKEAEETIQGERNLLRGVMDSTRDAIFSKDTEHRFRLSNATHQRILGASSQEEILGKTNVDYWGEERAAPFHYDDRRVLDHGESIVDREEKVHSASGSEMWISTTKAPLRGSSGEIEGLVAVSRDITERRREQHELATTAARFGSLIQNMPSGILVEDENHHIRYANAAITGMFEMEATPEELAGEDCGAAARYIMSLLADPEGFVERVEEILAEARPVTGEEILLADGRVYERDYIPIYVWGEHRGHTWHYRDLTGRKQVEETLREREERFRALFDQTAVGICVANLDRRLLETNEAYQKITGYDEEELVGMSTLELTHPEDREADTRVRGTLVSDDSDSYRRAKRYVRKDDAVIWAEATSSLVRDEAGEPKFILGVVEDITERRQAQEALAESERLLRAVTRGASIIIFATDFDGVITISEGKGLALVGRAPGQDVGNSVFEVYAYLPEITDNVRRALDGQEVAATVEAAGQTFESRYSPMRNDKGEITGSVGVATDVTTKRELEKEMEHRAFHDPLTDLPNRALFMDRLEHALIRSSKRGERVAVLFLDLDDFKHVNDSMGHNAGDRLLITTGQRIRSCLRDEDTVARLSGDEFAVLLEGVQDPDFPRKVAQRVSSEIRSPINLDEEAEEISPEIIVTTSIGMALNEPEDGLIDAEELLQRADTALYNAKETGKDHHELFHQEMKESSTEFLRMGRDLRRALESEELTVHYQLKKNLQTGETSGMEALVRWEHQERGLVYPDEFISLAEDNGLIVPLGLRVLHKACEQFKEWQELYPAGPGQPPLKICVNLSVRQLQSPGLVEDVSGILSETGLEPSRLLLEITESTFIRQDSRVTSALHGLKRLGVKLAIDDFGSGYSSLSYLNDLPVDVLKIDRSLVTGMGNETAKAEIVAAAISVAHALGLKAVAEGVETAGDLEELRRLGCDFGQGYYWSKPLPADAAAALLQRPAST